MLDVVSYHPDIQPIDEPGNASDPVTKDGQDALKPIDSGVVELNEKSANVVGREPDWEELPLQSIVVGTSMSSVAIIKSLSAIHLSAHHSAVIPVQVKGVTGSVLIEECNDCLSIYQSMVEAKKDGVTALWITNVLIAH